MSEKMSHEEFVKKAIVSLRKEGYKGIHTIYSGFNEAFKKYFEGENPVEVTKRLAEEGKIVIRPVKGGVMLYLPQDAPIQATRGDDASKFVLNVIHSVCSGLKVHSLGMTFLCSPRKTLGLLRGSSLLSLPFLQSHLLLCIVPAG